MIEEENIFGLIGHIFDYRARIGEIDDEDFSTRNRRSGLPEVACMELGFRVATGATQAAVKPSRQAPW